MTEDSHAPTLRSYLAVGLFAGMAIAPALWLAPLLLSLGFGGVLAVSPIITSFAQFTAIFVMGIVLGPLVTGCLWVLARVASLRSGASAPNASDEDLLDRGSEESVPDHDEAR